MLSLRPKPIEQTHEEVFLERYEKLYGWLCQLTDGDRELARDLVQDAFVHFTFVRPDLRPIKNLDGYLFSLARNLHISQVRRPTNSRLQQLSILDYDSSEWGLRMTDVREQIQVQDELRRICHYACVRKETAWASSVLILRFFYGYYAAEIASVLRNTRASVDVLLRCARHEAKAYLKDPRSLPCMKESSITPLGATSFARERPDFLEELRQMIFSSRRGDCFTADQLKSLYLPANDKSVTCVELAHIVSCKTCLDVVNGLLDLMPLSQRHPIATLGRDRKPKDKRGGGDGGPSGGGAAVDDLRSIKRHAEETFDHKPTELYVAVNGYTLGSHKVNAKCNELTLDVNVTEPIDFIEVFSEQQVRLLFANVEDPPAGPIKQPVSVALSDERRLDATLRFRSPWPSLHISYSDPAFIEIDEAVISAYEQDPAGQLAIAQVSNLAPRNRTPWSGYAARVVAVVTGSAGQFFRPSFWAKPVTVTVILALLLASFAVWINRRVAPPNLTATDLLQQSSIAEQALASRTDLILHRTITLEERSLPTAAMIGGQSVPGAVATGSSATSSDGHLATRRRIEIWQSGEKGITARRLYDNRGSLIAGDWRRSDGVQTLYHHGSKPQTEFGNRQLAIGNSNVWQLSPSAKDFSDLLGQIAAVPQLTEQGDTYVISVQSAPSAKSVDVVRATLTLSKADLHATELTLVVAAAPGDSNANGQSAIGNQQWREFRFLEASFERRAPSTVAPAVFEPEPELLGEAATGRRSETATLSPSSTLPLAASPIPASPELEVEVLSLLSRVGADLDDQTTVTRTSEGRLRVSGIVDTDQRKAEIVHALASVASNPAVKIEVETVAEAMKRRAREKSSSGVQSVDQVEISESAIPAHEELRRYFSKGSEEEIGRFAERMVNRSAQAMSHAGVLRRLVKQFSQEDLRTMNPEARDKWLGMIRAHARAFQGETAALRRDLQPIFFPNAPAGAASNDGIVVTDDASLLRAVERLYELGAANDQVIRAAFTTSSVQSAASAIKSAQFFRSLKSAEVLAATIASTK
ncbi:MAG TPA: hypothetical protein VIX17_00890 [Pyrinomonadaceae bacterium]|jgi:DNA-directed RNA polymerase specialized sigma24 family protein